MGSAVSLAPAVGGAQTPLGMATEPAVEMQIQKIPRAATDPSISEAPEAAAVSPEAGCCAAAKSHHASAAAGAVAEISQSFADLKLDAEAVYTEESAQCMSACSAPVVRATPADTTADPANVNNRPATVMLNDKLPLQLLQIPAVPPACSSREAQVVPPNRGPEAIQRAPTAMTAPMHLLTSTAAPREPDEACAGQPPEQQTMAASAPPATSAAVTCQGREANPAPAAAAPAEPGQASVGQEPEHISLASAQPAASAVAASLCRKADAAPAAAAPKGPGHTSVGQPPDQQASADSAQAAASAAAASQGGEATVASAAEECCTLRLHEQKVAAALLVVLKPALQEGGTERLKATVLTLMANNPLTSPLLGQLPIDSSLLSLKQLERLAACAPTYLAAKFPDKGQLPSDWMDVLAQQCATAGFEPLVVYRRSAECVTHVKALYSAELAARLQRLHAIEASLALKRPVQPDEEEIHQAIAVKVNLLSQRGMPRNLCDLMSELLYEVIILLYADRLPQNRNRMTAGAKSSFTVCIDHMLPGEHAAEATPCFH